MKLHKPIVFTIVLLLFSNLFLIAQPSLEFQLNNEAALAVKEHVPEGQSLLVFETDLDLEFESSVEYLKIPKYQDNKYYLFVNSGPQVITLKYFGDYNISFGQIRVPNTLPSLKSKEIKYFSVSKVQNLDFFDITDKEKNKGNIGIPVGVNVSDALVVIDVFPPELELIITDTKNGITKMSAENGKYKIFLTAPGEHILQLKNQDFDITNIPIKNIGSKDMRFYIVRKPTSIEEVYLDAKKAADYYCKSLELTYKAREKPYSEAKELLEEAGIQSDMWVKTLRRMQSKYQGSESNSIFNAEHSSLMSACSRDLESRYTAIKDFMDLPKYFMGHWVGDFEQCRFDGGLWIERQKNGKIVLFGWEWSGEVTNVSKKDDTFILKLKGYSEGEAFNDDLTLKIDANNNLIYNKEFVWIGLNDKPLIKCTETNDSGN